MHDRLSLDQSADLFSTATEVELQKVSAKLGIKFISIHKEAIHPKSYQKVMLA